MKIIEIAGLKKPIFSWCHGIEQGALDQMLTIAKLPFVKHCAIMPDGHLGKNMCIGGVVATEDVVVPDFVGVDAGCGVIVIKSSLKRSELLDVGLREKIHASVSRGIPMGFSHNSQDRIKDIKEKYGSTISSIFEKTQVVNEKYAPVDKVEDAFYSQCGSLGGGNHYASLDYDEDDNIWIMVHSGSRNIGKRMGDYFNKIASELNQKWHSVDTSGIPFLPTDTDVGRSYLKWLDFALKFAFLNRVVMIDEMIKDITHILPHATFDQESRINIHHNYASLENHFGKNVWVHRKGAVMAKEGTKGIIPGSMNTESFITVGLGCRDSLCSSSHGAGRNEGRKSFNVKMNTPEGIAAIKKSMEGVVYSGFGKAGRGRDEGMLDVSESPAAYKDILSVMENQKDLVKPVHTLKTMINWKDSGD